MQARRMRYFLFFFLMMAAPVAAQSVSSPSNTPSPPAADVMPVYQIHLDRLAEILGALHYLDRLCTPDHPSLWRAQMNELIELEASTPTRKSRMRAAFNHGYAGFAASYQHCTPNAQSAATRYRLEGTQLARDVANRYAE